MCSTRVGAFLIIFMSPLNLIVLASSPELHCLTRYVVTMTTYRTPCFRAINRQNTTPIKSSPLAVPPSVASHSVAKETRQTAPSNASTRTLPVRALKIMASVEKYTPAPNDSEPEQPDSDYETESSATRDTTTESEQRAADEQERADKGRARERRRNGSAGGSSNTRQGSSLQHAQEGRQETGKSRPRRVQRYINVV